MRRLIVACLVGGLLGAKVAAGAGAGPGPGAGPARTDPLKVLVPVPLRQAARAVAADLQRQSGLAVDADTEAPAALVRRAAGAEAIDVVVLPPSALGPLAGRGRIDAESVRPVARVEVGVAVRAGARLPALGTVEAFRKAVLAARRVAYLDPASGDPVAVHLDGVFEQLQVGDAVRAKAVRVDGGRAADRLATGEADLALQPVSELVGVPGVAYAGPLPEALQFRLAYAGAVASASTRQEDAARFLDALRDPALRRTHGLLPP